MQSKCVVCEENNELYENPYFGDKETTCSECLDKQNEELI